jgi:hypothetical protein
MKLLTCHNGQLHAARSEFASIDANRRSSFVTGFAALDELLPNGAFARGAVHELLAIPSHPSPFFIALMFARAAMEEKKFEPQINTDEHRLKRNTKLNFGKPASEFYLCSSVFICGSKSLCGAIVWCDPQGKLYPPAVAAMGVPLDRLFLLRPKTIPDENWAIAECLRCRGVSATIASPRRLSRIEARRFQLAAERGKGIGILLRPYDRTANVYSATTRWLISPQRD